MNMTKKKYIAPDIEVVEMEMSSMLALSNDEEIGGNPDEEGEELSNRRRNYWDEIGGWK